MAIKKLPTPIERNEVMRISAKALLIPPESSAPKAKKTKIRIVAWTSP
jgi:hypothetical protein